MGYLQIPKVLTFNDIKDKNFLSPLCYTIVYSKNKNRKPLLKFIDNETPIKGEEVGSPAYIKHSYYFFMRTQAISDSKFTLIKDDSDSFVPITKSFFDEEDDIEKKSVKIGDIFYVKGGNVGAVGIADSEIQAMFSSHIFKFKINPELRYYVFAILKNDFGKLQVNNLPIGVIKGLDSFRTEYLNNIFIPLPKNNSQETIKYISLLVESVIRKEATMNENQNIINKIIEKELIDNQKNSHFQYNLPNFSDIKNEGRLDTGLYSELYEKILFLIKNYKYGFSDLLSLGYIPSRGQNLQISNIGKSIYSEIPKDGFYKLILSKNITKSMTVNKFIYLGSNYDLKTIKSGEIIFTCRGDMGRCLIFCDETKNTITNIDNLHLTNNDASLIQNIFIGVFLNYLKFLGFIDKIAVGGSGADSITKHQFDLIKIPIFPKNQQEKISKYYYNPVSYKENLSLEDFEEEDIKITKESGIIQLDKQIKSIKQKIDQTINNIVNDEETSLEFNFF
jgi:type I restriction enzyme S subunit